MDETPTPTPPAPETPPAAASPAAEAPPPSPPRATMPPPFLPPQPAAQPRPRNNSGWKVLAIILLVLLPILLFLNPLHMMTAALSGEAATLPTHRVIGPRLQEAWIEHSGSRNKIAVIKVEGVIMGQSMGHSGYSMVDVIEDQFERAAKDQNVKAVVLKVNSPGGEVLASDDIYKVIQKFQEKSGKPVVADMGSLAASGGYYVSAPCQWIVANELTITGSIGVIMHGYNWRGLMDKVGVRPEVFKSGRFKDMLSPDKRPEEITAEEREMIQSMVNETFDKFKSIVREGRAYSAKKNQSGDASRELVENWEQYADGRILSGKEAQRLGFVDELGDFKTAVARARKLANITESDVITYHQPFDLGDLFNIFGQTESRAVKIDLGIDAPKLQLGRLYFLCPLVLPR